jgi:hypothetical protein
MKFGWLAPVIVAIAVLPGCKSRSSSTAYNPRYDGLTGIALPPVNLSILKDQSALAAKYAANAAPSDNLTGTTPTPATQP